MKNNASGTIRQVLQNTEGTEYLSKLLIDKSINTSNKLAQELCRKFDFKSPSGEYQISSCHVVINDMEKRGLIRIPKARVYSGRKFTSLTRHDVDIPLPPDYPKTINKTMIADLEIILLTKGDKKLNPIWNELIAREHPQKDKRLVGYWVKYLIKYNGYYIGAACFNSCAYNLEARDEWLGWTRKQFQEYQHHFINMGRFLIRNKIKCANLASHLISKLTKLIKKDFHDRYGVKPWVIETFADTMHCYGLCYKAANWQLIGQSKGRGRDDVENKYDKSIKNIYLHIVEPNFRKLAGFEPEKPKYPQIKLERSLNEQWAVDEFSDLVLGDERVSNRVVSIAKHKGQQPSQPFAKAANGLKSEIKGFYNFLQNDNDEINSKSLLSTHRNKTMCRAKEFKRVLSIQDTSDLNYSGLIKTEGLGIIGKNHSNTSGTKGLMLHANLLTDMRGIPLGVPYAEFTSPKAGQANSEKEKESQRWLRTYEDDIAMAKELEGTQIISVMDREGDIYNLLELANKNRKRNPIVVRSNHNRKLADESRLKWSVAWSDPKCHITVDIPPQRERPKTTDKKIKRKYIPARKAELAINYKEIEILRPESDNNSKLPSMKVTVVYAKEVSPPKGAEKIEWYITTTLPVLTHKDALDVIRIYKKRWRIEEYFRVLKSGCLVEKYKLDSAKKLERVVTIDLVIAWRIMLFTFLAREYPNVEIKTIFSSDELAAMHLVNKKKLQ